MNKEWLYYLASPYSDAPAGKARAFEGVCTIASKLISQGYKIYSPIAHSHSIAYFGGLDPDDYDIWMPLAYEMMKRCDAMIIARLPGWQMSKGIDMEWAYFNKAGKPTFHVSPKGEIL